MSARSERCDHNAYSCGVRLLTAGIAAGGNRFSFTCAGAGSAEEAEEAEENKYSAQLQRRR